MVLRSWAKFSNGLIHLSIRMIHAKNYETVPKFVKVMPFPDTVYVRLNKCTNVLWIRNCRTLLHICAWQIMHVRSPDGSTFMCEMTTWPPP